MAGQAGRRFVLRTGNPMATVANLRSVELSGSSEAVSAGTQTSNGWDVLIEDAGMASVTISCEGTFKGAGKDVIMERFNQKTIDGYEVVADDGESFTGNFQVTEIQPGGVFNDGVSFSFSLQSSGVVTYSDGS